MKSLNLSLSSQRKKLDKDEILLLEGLLFRKNQWMDNQVHQEGGKLKDKVCSQDNRDRMIYKEDSESFRNYIRNFL